MAFVAETDHGGNIYAAARKLGRRVNRLIDFSASINPLGPSPLALQAIVRAPRLVQHYPDPECVALRDALAAHWGLHAEQIVIGNGSTELIYLIPAALSLRHLVIMGPTFSEYAKAMSKTGGTVTMVMAERAGGYVPPVKQLLRLMKASGKSRQGPFDAVLLCNPNSPTGQACAAEDVMEVARLAQRREMQLIVDETFADYCEERSILPAAIPSSGAIVLRSFTKFYGLPGLRVGYMLATAQTAGRIRVRQPPWSVNAVAQEAARVALNDARHAKQSRSFMSLERARFHGMLTQIPDCTLFPSQANFFQMELPEGRRASVVAEQLRRQGLLIRDCSAVPGLNERTVRLAVRQRADNDKLAHALARLLRQR